MKLTDTDKLMQDIRNTITEQSTTLDWLNLINRQTTAYDVSAVVKQLETLREECEDPLQDYDPEYFINKVIEIVKEGGV